MTHLNVDAININPIGWRRDGVSGHNPFPGRRDDRNIEGISPGPDNQSTKESKAMTHFDQRVKEPGIALPEAQTVFGNYVPCRISRNQVFIAVISAKAYLFRAAGKSLPRDRSLPVI